MHHSSRETRTQDIILPGILTRLGEASVILLVVESWDGKEKMMIATAVIIMFNIRYPYMKKANQIQWYGTSNSSAEPIRWFMWRFHCRAATALPIWIPSAGGGSYFGTENSASSVFIEAVSRFAAANRVIMDFPIASRKLNDKTTHYGPWITGSEKRAQTLICWFWCIVECTQWHEKSSADDGEEHDKTRWTNAQDTLVIVSTQVGIWFLCWKCKTNCFMRIFHNPLLILSQSRCRRRDGRREVLPHSLFRRRRKELP